MCYTIRWKSCIIHTHDHAVRWFFGACVLPAHVHGIFICNSLVYNCINKILKVRQLRRLWQYRESIIWFYVKPLCMEWGDADRFHRIKSNQKWLACSFHASVIHSFVIFVNKAPGRQQIFNYFSPMTNSHRNLTKALEFS